MVLDLILFSGTQFSTLSNCYENTKFLKIPLSFIHFHILVTVFVVEFTLLVNIDKNDYNNITSNIYTTYVVFT